MHPEINKPHNSDHSPTPHEKNSLAAPNYIPSLGGVAFSKCPRYHKGHSVHWIQTSRAKTAPWEPATILAANGNFITFSTESGIHTGWNHEADMVQSMADIAALVEGASSHWCERYSLLTIEHSAGALIVYLSDEDAGHCPLNTPPS